MKYYKDALNNINAYEEDGSQDEFIPVNLILITEAEANILRAPTPLTVEQKRALLQPLSAWQVRKVLTQLGLRDSVETAVAVSTQATKDAWNHAEPFHRDDPILNAMGASLGMTASQLDDLFTLGATL